MVSSLRSQPEMKNLTLEGVSLTLQDVNLKIPGQDFEQRLNQLEKHVLNLTEIA